MTPLLLAAACWLYQLQNPDPAEIARSGFAHVIIDGSREGNQPFTPEELAPLKKAGVTALCYISIGEAENYRPYWKPEWKTAPPVWLGRENPDWKGNFEVRYWHPEWRETVLRPWLAQIKRQGFDGVYLDIVDGFEYWGDEDNFKPGREIRQPDDPKDEAEAAARMIELVAWIKETSGLKVFPQNGERLMTFSPKFIESVDGFGVESLWFRRKARQPLRGTEERLTLLRQARDAGKTVVVTDYIDDGSGLEGKNGERIREFTAFCDREKLGRYVARVNQQLDSINRLPGIQP